MNIFERLFHEHKYEKYPTDRWADETGYTEEGVYLCTCGKLDPNVGKYSIRGGFFKNRKLPNGKSAKGHLRGVANGIVK